MGVQGYRKNQVGELFCLHAGRIDECVLPLTFLACLKSAC